jgi:phage host-nuclease inhibitor protein Gam
MEMTEQFERTARDIEERVRPQIEEAKKKIGDLNDQVTTYIKANPGKCLLGAIAAGFIIGRIARR